MNFDGLAPYPLTTTLFRIIQELAGFGSASSDRSLADELKSRPAVVKPALMACEIKKFQAIGMQLLSRLATHDALDPANFSGVGPVLKASAEVSKLRRFETPDGRDKGVVRGIETGWEGGRKRRY